MEHQNKLGRSIQVLRESHMMTRGDLAQILGITRKELVEWEEGRALPKAEQIVELAGYFSVDPRSLVDEPGTEGPEEMERPAGKGGKKLAAGVIVLVLGVVVLLLGVGLLQGLSTDMGEAPASSSGVEESLPLPECLTLAEVELTACDLDGDSEAELVNPDGKDILLIQDGKAYALAEPLGKGQTLTAQDGVFIVKNEKGESRIYSRLRNGAIYPAG